MYIYIYYYFILLLERMELHPNIITVVPFLFKFAYNVFY